MKVLLDEGVPHPLAAALSPHDVQAVEEIGCKGIKNGKLLNIIEQLSYHIFITADKNIPDQQILSRRPFAVLVLSTNNWPIMRGHIANISRAIDESMSGEVIYVDCGAFLPARRKHRPDES